jgi:hypothetical protein
MEKTIKIKCDNGEISIDIEGFSNIEIIGLFSYYHQFYSTELYKSGIKQNNNPENQPQP